MHTLEMHCVHTNADLMEIRLAEDWEAVEDGYDLSWPTPNGEFEIPLDLQFTIIALLLDEDQYKKERIGKLRPQKTQLISHQLKLHQCFRHALMQRLIEYPMTIAQDTELLKNTNLKRRHRMAIEVRLGEKEILAMALDATNNLIEDIRGEYRENLQERQIASSTKRRKV